MKKSTQVILGYASVFLIVIPLFISILIYHSPFDVFSPEISERGDILQFWGAYLAAVIAIGGIYWQVETEIRHNDEKEVKNARPVFSLTYDKNLFSKINEDLLTYVSSSAFIGDLKDIYKNKDPLGRMNESGFPIVISNPSMKPMLFVKVVITYTEKIGNTESEDICISRIDAGKKVQCIPYQFIYNHLTRYTERSDKSYLPLIKKIDVNLTTEKDEKLKYCYRKGNKNDVLKRVDMIKENYNINQFDDSPNILLNKD